MSAPVVRAKFRVNLITPYADAKGQPTGSRIDLAPVYDSNKDSENARFFNMTPWGQITLATVNPAAAENFKLGGEFYVDFTPAAAGQ